MSYPPPDPPPPPDDPVPPAYHPYQQPIYAYGHPAPNRPTDGLAIASLAVSCASVLGICAYGIGGLLGIVGAALGHAARRRIARSGEQGAGMALAGIIVGWIMAAVALTVIGLLVYFIASDAGAPSTSD
jgi:hypothetical protein